MKFKDFILVQKNLKWMPCKVSLKCSLKLFYEKLCMDFNSFVTKINLCFNSIFFMNMLKNPSM